MHHQLVGVSTDAEAKFMELLTRVGLDNKVDAHLTVIMEVSSNVIARSSSYDPEIIF